LSGVQAYAEKQAALLKRLACKSAAYWLPALKKKGVVPEWEAQYSLASGDDLPGGDSDADQWEDDEDEVVDDHFDGEEQDLSREKEIMDSFECDD
jgi:hypothetical protein